MFAAAAEKAKSLDPVKVAAALEGMKFEVFNGGEGYMRKDDHQFFQPMYIASFGERSEKRAVRRGEDRLGLEAGRQDRHRRDRAADHLQDGTAVSYDRVIARAWLGRPTPVGVGTHQTRIAADDRSAQ